MKLYAKRRIALILLSCPLALLLIVCIAWPETDQGTSKKLEPNNSSSSPAWRPFKAQAVLSNAMIDKLSEKIEEQGYTSIPNDRRRALRRVTKLALNANLTFLIEPTKLPIRCPARTSGSLKLLIVVNSKWSNFERRKSQRAFWLNEFQLSRLICEQTSGLMSIEYVFALGTGGQSSPPAQSAKGARGEPESVREEVRKEAEKHGDILLLNQLEHYRLLSHKHLAIFRWILERRARSKERLLVLKCDDDALVDLGQLMTLLGDQLEAGSEGTNKDNWIMCARFEKDSPVQRRLSKWLVSRQDYPFDSYPAFCSGLAYLAPASLMRRLYTTALYLASLDGAQFEQPFWIDDVFVTGILAASMSEPPSVVPLNNYFCYSMSQFWRRLKLGAPCMVAEIPDTHLQDTALHLNGVEAS